MCTLCAGELGGEVGREQAVVRQRTRHPGARLAGGCSVGNGLRAVGNGRATCQQAGHALCRLLGGVSAPALCCLGPGRWAQVQRQPHRSAQRCTLFPCPQGRPSLPVPSRMGKSDVT